MSEDTVFPGGRGRKAILEGNCWDCFAMWLGYSPPAKQVIQMFCGMDARVFEINGVV